MWFAVPELARHDHRIKKCGHAKLIDDAAGRWRMRQVGQETEAVFPLEGGKHVHGSRDGRSIIDKRAKIRLNRQGNTRVIGLDLVSQLLQGGADPEPIVRLLAVVLCRLHKPPGCGAVDREKGLVCNGQPTALQALHQSPHSFLATQVFHRHEGLKQVKTNGRNMLHDGSSLSSADACQHAMACRVPGRLVGVNSDRCYVSWWLYSRLSLLQQSYTLCALYMANHMGVDGAPPPRRGRARVGEKEQKPSSRGRGVYHRVRVPQRRENDAYCRDGGRRSWWLLWRFAGTRWP